MRGSSSVHEPIGQLDSGHTHRRLCQTRRIGRPDSGQVDQLDSPSVLHVGDHPAPRATLRGPGALDAYPQGSASNVLDIEDHDVGQANQ